MPNLIEQFISQHGKDEITWLVDNMGNVRKQIDSINRKGLKLEVDIKGVNNLKEYLEMSSKLKAVNADLAASHERLANIKKLEAEARYYTAAAINEENKALDRMIKLRDNAVRLGLSEQKQIIALTSEYKIQSKALEELRQRAADYMLTLGEQHPLTQEIVKQVEILDARLKKVDATLGVHRRNVGHYNSIASSFNQILREMPNAGISAQTLLMSLTNNVTYFVESIIGALKAGATWKQIMNILSTSLLGPIGLLNIAITLITIFGQQLIEQKDPVEEMHKAMDKLNESIEKYNQNIEKAGQNAQNNSAFGTDAIKRELDLLRARGASEQEIFAKSQELRKKELSDLRVYYETIRYGEQSKADAALRAIRNKEQEINSSGVQFQREQYEKLLSLQAEANKRENAATAEKALVNLNEIKENNKLIVENQQYSLEERLNALVRFTNAETTIENVNLQRKLQDIEFARKEEIRKARENGANIAEINRSFDAQRSLAQSQFDSKVTSIQSAGERARTDMTQKELEIQLQYRIDSLDKIDAQYDISYRKDLGKLHSSLKNKEISVTQYERRRNQVEAIYAIEKLNAQAAYLKEELDNFQGTSAQKAVLEKKYNDVVTTLKEKEVEVTISAEGLKQEKYRETIAVLRIALDTLNTIGQTISLTYDSKIDAIQKRMKVVEQASQDEIDLINATMVAGEKKEEALVRAKAKATGELIALEEKEAQQRKKKATFEKSLAIATIVANTAIAISEALKIPVYGEAKAIAIGIAGAAQIANVMSQPIPEYYKGVKSSPEGFAWIGEKGTELRINPDNSVELTPAVATLAHLQAGTEIIPHDKTVEILRSVQFASVNGFTPSSDSAGFNGRMLANVYKDATERSADRIVKAISRSRQSPAQKDSFKHIYNNPYYRSTFKS